MPDKNENNSRKTGAANRRGGIQDCPAAERETSREGLRILARIIARAHLQRPQMESALGKRPLARHQNQRAGGEQSTERPTPPADPSGSF